MGKKAAKAGEAPPVEMKKYTGIGDCFSRVYNE
jgi:hypothetical protein